MSIDRETLRNLFGRRRIAEVPGLAWAGDVTFRVRSLSEAERANLLEAWTYSENGTPIPGRRELFKVRIVQLTLCDTAGDAIYPPDDNATQEVASLDSGLINAIADFAIRHLRMSPADQRKLSDVEKNSAAGQSGS